MKKIIIGNWKMNKTLAEAVAYVQEVGELLNQLSNIDVVLCPPFLSLAVMEGLLRGTRVKLGAQTVSDHKNGAFTGDVSASMLAGHCEYVIVGHSERRRGHQETMEQINDQVVRCVEQKLQPVVCISNEDELASLKQIKDKLATWIVAYEPLSAIGTGNPADPESVIAWVKRIKSALGKSTVVIYGGSVDASNVRDYLAISDGVLPGKASLDPQGFLALCQAANR